MITYKDIEISFEQGTRQIVEGVSFELRPGTRTVLLGANGSGKSSLLWALMGIVSPTKGSIRLDEFDAQKPEDITAIRQALGFVGQRPDDLIVSTTVEAEVAFGPENLRVEQAELRARVNEALARVGLSGFEKREPASLSGGQKQRLVMAAALAMKPRYLLLDEPFAMLDPSSADAMLELVEELRASGIGMLHITHNLAEAHTADEIIVLHDKKMAFKGSFEELLEHQDSFKAWGIELETPQVVRDFEPTSGAPSVYSLDHLDLSYEDAQGESFKALFDLNMNIHKGDFVLIEGESGAGKTSLLKILAGALKADKGSKAQFKDDELSLKTTRGKVGLVFQDAEQSFFAETVLEEVMFGPLQMGIPRAEALEKSTQELHAVGLNPDLFSARLPFNLSGGEARRLALASVLSFGPEVILADEPTASLDAPSRLKVRELLAKESKDKTLIVVTHAPHEFIDMANKHFRIEAGRIFDMRAGS